MNTYPEKIAAEIQKDLKSLRKKLKKGIEGVEDPHAEGLFETSAEVVGGIEKAFKHFQNKSEGAWK